ncbi:hypothetical protein E2M46_11345 [Salmonella enterica subsp. enterica serovar Othmarschen]|nr:hypothetical protein [Salmonella enterica subsp. enterica serovar Othmarschen]
MPFPGDWFKKCRGY